MQDVNWWAPSIAGARDAKDLTRLHSGAWLSRGPPSVLWFCVTNEGLRREDAPDGAWGAWRAHGVMVHTESFFVAACTQGSLHSRKRCDAMQGNAMQYECRASLR